MIIQNSLVESAKRKDGSYSSDRRPKIICHCEFWETSITTKKKPLYIHKFRKISRNSTLQDSFLVACPAE
jgi:hypothetical protein